MIGLKVYKKHDSNAKKTLGRSIKARELPKSPEISGFDELRKELIKLEEGGRKVYAWAAVSNFFKKLRRGDTAIILYSELEKYYIGEYYGKFEDPQRKLEVHFGWGSGKGGFPFDKVLFLLDVEEKEISRKTVAGLKEIGDNRYGAVLTGEDEEKVRKILEGGGIVEEGGAVEEGIPRGGIKKYIDKGENKKIEFKETFLYDVHQDRANKELKEEAVKEICAFANSEGGKLIIGVEDEAKNVKGLKRDFEIMNGGQNDFEEQLSQEIAGHLGEVFASRQAEVSFEDVNDKTVCVVDVGKSSDPVYFDEKEFYIRRGSSSVPLNVKEAREYIDKHFERNF